MGRSAHAMDQDDDFIATVIPHSSFGDPKCCGCLEGIASGDQGEVVCTECNTVVRSVPRAALRQTLTEMELDLHLSTAICRHCGAVKLARGFSELRAFTCDSCGEVTKLADDPMSLAMRSRIRVENDHERWFFDRANRLGRNYKMMGLIERMFRAGYVRYV